MHENREISRTSRTKQERDRTAKVINHNADTHALEESDCAIVPMNRPNKGEQSSTEAGEGRAWTKENIAQSNTSPTQSGERVSQGLNGVRQVAKVKKQERFTALLHHRQERQINWEGIRAKSADPPLSATMMLSSSPQLAPGL